MITIYSTYLTSRLQYAVDVVFKQVLELEVVITNQKQNLNGVVINYSNETIYVSSFNIIRTF